MSRWDDALLMGELQPLGCLQDIVDGLGNCEWPILLDQGREIASLDVLHDQEVNAVGLIGIVGGDDIGVCRSLAAALTSRSKRATAAASLVTLLGQHLDRHGAIHTAMLGLVHLAHAARPDLVKHGVVAEDQPFDPPLINLLGLEPWSSAFA